MRTDTDSGVLHTQTRTIVTFRQGSNKQVTRAFVNISHRIRSVPKQIQDDLLELNTITDDRREVLGKVRPQGDTIPLKIAHRQCNYFSGGLVQIQGLQGELFFTEQRTQSRDHICSAIAVPKGPPHCLARPVDIRRITLQHPKTCTGVGDNARKRLIDLVSDRASQRVQSCHT